MALDDLRKDIDTIDDEILALLARRAEVVGKIREAKRELGVFAHDPERERKVLSRLVDKGAGTFPSDAIARVFREVMSASVSMQEPVEVSFLGPEGTYSHMAARHLFGLSARYVEAATIEGVVDAVRRSACRYGVVPIENSTEGPVTSTIDALLEGGVSIRGESVLPVSHCLLGAATGLTQIERVYSHPQALAQCRLWLSKNLAQAQLVQTSSTTTAVREALLDPRAAAIGSALCSELYGISILRERIQDRAENATRFVTLAKSDAPRTGQDKTTLAFALPEEQRQGALRRTLEIFDTAGVNLTHIESRPSPISAWAYVFVVDVEGHREDPHVAQAIAALRVRCGEVSLLGSYPRGGV